MDRLEKKEDRLKAWFKNIEDIGATPCIEPGSSSEALEGFATVLGTAESIEHCVVWPVSSE